MLTADLDTRHVRKTRMHRRDGFKVHIVVEPDTGLATGVEMTRAAGREGADYGVRARLVTAVRTLEMSPQQAGPVTPLGDTAYKVGPMLHVLQDHLLTPLIKPWLLH